MFRRVKNAARLIMAGEFQRFILILKSHRLVRIKNKIASCGGLVFEIIQIVVTQKCTLKCTKCTAMMQYYTDPKHTPGEQVIRDTGLMMDKIDYTMLLNFVGGETFLIKNLSTYVEYALEKYKMKFGMIVIVTNGTIVPPDDELERLAKFRKRIFVRISDYGEKSAKMKQLQEALRKHRILFIADDLQWKNWQQIVDGESNNDEYAKSAYQNCLAKNDCNMVLDGKFYHCVFLMSGEALRAFPYSNANHVDIADADTTRKDIIQYKSADNVPPGCRWCSGAGEDAPIVPKAEQASGPMEYKVYGA